MASRQEEREASARQAALGRRAKVIQDGHMGPVLKRWINADVAPVAALLRKVAIAYTEGDMGEVAFLLDTPTAEISSRERPLTAIMEWCLRGKSPGRKGSGGGEEGGSPDTTFADDLALAFLASVVLRLAKSGSGKTDTPSTVAYALSVGADAMRDTVQGQFISHVQGASAMEAIRERQPEAWQQKKSLNRICARLSSQVRPQLIEDARRVAEGEAPRIKTRGARKVLEVVGHTGDTRMITLKEPDAIDWEVMTLCWRDDADGADHHYRNVWLAFAGLVLSAVQRVSGWFDVVDQEKGRGRHKRRSRLLVLSEKARESINKDVERWVGLGFHAEPMVVPPVDGDYLTVKHRKVTGQRAPLGLTTRPEETTPWLTGACALSTSPWTVNVHALTVEATSPNDILRIAEHRRLAMEEALYLPVTMDFRGRIYYRPTWVSPQSGDLGKSLLCFPPSDREGSDETDPEAHTVAMHMAGLYGGPDKLDKAPLSKRLEWWVKSPMHDQVFKDADKPLTLAAHWALYKRGEWDRIPIQLDGTCNGLQHLSALFRDEEGAKHVNLVRSSLEDTPADIYGRVAHLVDAALGEMIARARFDLVVEVPGWARRLMGAGIVPDRSLCKTPVMVLPYGGTREAVRQAVRASLLERLSAWEEPPPEGTQPVDPWRLYEDDNYGAFRGRNLSEHPLFRADAGALAGLIWDSIAPAIPKAMAAMGALQAIGSYVGERGLSWRVGVGPEGQRLWVTQAKSKSERKQVTMKGFHLPDLVRRLSLNASVNEVDGKAHRTGIVANFIHSQDAAHLARTVALFRSRGGTCVGSVHDCVMVRPSEARLMGECLRDAFVELYTVRSVMPGLSGVVSDGYMSWGREGPLGQPVRLWKDKDTLDCEFTDWYALAEAAGVAFPEVGSFDITEVRHSAWFFS